VPVPKNYVGCFLIENWGELNQNTVEINVLYLLEKEEWASVVKKPRFSEDCRAKV
jgi:hypothetical protein